MPVSIINIDVNDEAFLKFRKEFEKYQDALAKMPAMWGKVKDQIDAATTAQTQTGQAANSNTPRVAATSRAARNPWFGTVTPLPVSPKPKVPDKIKPVTTPDDGTKKPSQKEKAANEAERFERSAKSAKREMNEVEKHTSKIARNLAKATFDLIKWSGLALLAGGLFSGASLFGIDRMANQVGAGRRFAAGFGVTSAEQRAMNVNYSRAFDVDSVLGNIAHAKNTAEDQWIFGGMDTRSKDPAELAMQMADRARRIMKEGNGNLNYANAQGIDKVFDEASLRRLQTMSDQEYAQMQRKYLQDVKQFKISDEVQRRWQDLGVQLDRASNTIWTVLVNKLAPLTKPLENLSVAFVKFVTDLAESGKLKEWVDSLAAGIQWLGTYLTSDKFSKDVANFGTRVGEFITDIETFGSAVVRVIGKINNFLGLDEDPNAPKPWYNDPLKLPGVGGDPKAKTFMEWGKVHLWGKDNSSDDLKPYDGGVPESRKAATIDPKTGESIPDNLEKYYGLPKNFVNNIWGVESSYGAHKEASSAGALGDFQFIKGTADDYHLKDRNDYATSASAMAHYIYDLRNKFGGDLQKATAAYNWGPSALEDHIAAQTKAGRDWHEGLPKETADYLVRALSSVKVKSDINIKIDNHTGNDVAAIAAAAAAQR